MKYYLVILYIFIILVNAQDDVDISAYDEGFDPYKGDDHVPEEAAIDQEEEDHVENFGLVSTKYFQDRIVPPNAT